MGKSWTIFLWPSRFWQPVCDLLFYSQLRCVLSPALLHTAACGLESHDRSPTNIGAATQNHIYIRHNTFTSPALRLHSIWQFHFIKYTDTPTQNLYPPGVEIIATSNKGTPQSSAWCMQRVDTLESWFTKLLLEGHRWFLQMYLWFSLIVSSELTLEVDIIKVIFRPLAWQILSKTKWFTSNGSWIDLLHGVHRSVLLDIYNTTKYNKDGKREEGETEDTLSMLLFWHTSLALFHHYHTDSVRFVQ